MADRKCLINDCPPFAGIYSRAFIDMPLGNSIKQPLSHESRFCGSEVEKRKSV